MRCTVSNCDFTSAIDCKLNHRRTAAPPPCIFSFAFSMHKEKLCSMTCTSEPWPAFVMYLVIYSITASIVSVAWKSMLESIMSRTMGTKLLIKWQLRVNHNLKRSRRRGSSAISSKPGSMRLRGKSLLQEVVSCEECSCSMAAHG